MERQALLEREYEQLIRAVGREDLLERTELPDFERRVLRILAEGRASEMLDGSGIGHLHDRNPDELLAALRERLGTRRGYAFPIQLVYNEVVKACEEYGYTVPFQVLAAEFPTGSFNAQAVRMKHGVLLLINTGIMELYRFATLVTRSFTFRIEDDTAATRAQVAANGHDDLVGLMTQAVIAYLVTGSSSNVLRDNLNTGVADARWAPRAFSR